MPNEKINQTYVKLNEAIESLDELKNLYVREPSKDFSRSRKLPLKSLVRLLISMGGNTMNKELLEFFDYDVSTATSSAFIQQREKLLPEGLGYLFNVFTSLLDKPRLFQDYRILSVDGTDVNIPRNQNDLDSFVKSSPNSKGYNLLHLNILFDILNKQYLDLLEQPFKIQNEKRAVVRMVNRSNITDNSILLLDRGYESYNIMAHIMNKGWKFLIRVRDPNIHTSIISRCKESVNTEFDTELAVKLSRRNTKEYMKDPNHRLLTTKSTFDFLPAGSKGRYELKFRVVGVEVENGKFQYFVTNLERSEFALSSIGELYHLRWGIETSFRDLKYSLGLTSFHSKKINLIRQEIYAKMIMYNFCASIIINIMVKEKSRKYSYQVNFVVAICICRRMFSYLNTKAPPELEALIGRYILPIRKKRKYPRKVKFRSCISFNYRVA